MTYGSLFTGVGGIDLGLDRAGLECRWQVENDPYAVKVLKKHWPKVKRYGDIQTIHGNELEPVDLICGGFPCQDISRIGTRAGIDGERSGLWGEFFRLVCLLRPRILFVENVPGLLDGGIGRVLGDLASIGFDAEWECLPAAAFGSPQLRERIFIVAYSGGQRSQGIMQTWTAEMAARRSRGEHAGMDTVPMLRGISMHDPYGACPRLRMPTDRGMVERPLYGQGWWAAGPTVYRVAPGIRRRVDRIRTLGNSVVPDCAEWIGRRIIEFDYAFHYGTRNRNQQ
jgi:DNA (cytosine-5)-methyltransferase 1